MTQDNSNQETKFLHFLFNFLEAENINYVVIRNYETLPETVSGSDIDLLISEHEYRLLRPQLLNAVEKSGYRKWKEYPKNFNIQQISFTPLACKNPQDVVRIDFILDGINWWGYNLADSDMLWKSRIKDHGLWVLQEPMQSAVTFLNALLFTGEIKEKYIHAFKEINSKDRGFINAFLHNALNGYSDKIVQDLHNGQVIIQNKFALRVRFIQTQRRKLTGLVHGSWTLMRTAVARMLHPPGLFLVLVGPDGSGKTTVREMLVSKCKRLFPGIDFFHLFPKIRLFKYLDEISHKRWQTRHKTNQNEWEIRNSKSSFLASLMRLVYLTLRFWSGYLFWIYPRLLKGCLVIGERWHTDILFDPQSKGINLPAWLRKCFVRIIPSAQKTVVLTGAAKAIAERKLELPTEEVERQLHRIEEWLANKRGVAFVDSTADSEQTFAEALNFMVQ